MAPVVQWYLIRRDCPIGATFPQRGLGKSVVSYRLTLDTFRVESLQKKSHQIIAVTITASVSRPAAAMAVRPAFVR
jgi:hypothetical protein